MTDQRAVDQIKAERDRLMGINREHVDSHNRLVIQSARDAERIDALAAENKVLREAVQAFIDYYNCDELDISDVDLLLKFNEALNLSRAALTKRATK